MYFDKQAYLDRMQQDWSKCLGCPLSQERTNIVFGYGNPNAQVVVVGEAPGENEDKVGIPFVGKAGMLLDQYLGGASTHPEIKTMQEVGEVNPQHLRDLLLSDFYLTNVVACHPPENRDPAQKEIAACRPRLSEIIYVVDPVLILAVGKIGVEALTGRKVNITSVRGELFDITIPGRVGPVTYPVLAMVHTSYLLRQNDFKTKGGMSEKTFGDVLEAMRIVDVFNQTHFGIPRPKDRPIPKEFV